MSTLVPQDWAGRLARVRADLPRLNAEALVISAPRNIFYLCGFAGSSALLLVTADVATLITDGRYAFVVRQDLARGALGPVGLEVVEKRYDLTLGQMCHAASLGRVAYEAGHLTVALLGGWQRAAPTVSWVATERVVEQIRLIKDATECAILRRGGALISSVAGRLRTLVRAGQSERATARAIDDALEAAGFSGPAFPTIVASGPNSALPHARPSDRLLGLGDLVVLDFGGVLDGYCLDLTRMVAVGPPSERALSLYEAVKVAHGAAIAATKPGILTSDVDRAARSELEARGLGEAFLHSTGHGLGLEVHEAPRIGRADPETPETLQPGMVFTVEPGAYLDGFGGVRLEDDVLVTATGCEVITTASLDLLVV